MFKNDPTNLPALGTTADAMSCMFDRVVAEQLTAGTALTIVHQLDSQFIDESRVHLCLVSDRELEVMADLYKNTLSRARQGAQPLSAFARAKIWDLRGAQWAECALLDLFGNKGRNWAQSDGRRRHRIGSDQCR